MGPIMDTIIDSKIELTIMKMCNLNVMATEKPEDSLFHLNTIQPSGFFCLNHNRFCKSS